VRKTAVVVIDVQNGILDHLEGERSDVARRNLDGTVARIAGMLDRARQSGLPIIFVQHGGPAGHRLAVGSDGWRLRSELSPRDGEAIVHKAACDAFFETDLAERLRAHEADCLVIAGCMTEYCIDTTVRRAVSLGFDVTLAEDGHATGDSGALHFEQIIAHHNRLLDGFDAGERQVTLQPCAALPPRPQGRKA
jgi:nicotinamidase-related amidase